MCAELEGTAKRLVFECCGGSVKARLQVPITLYEWQPLCFALHLLARNLTLAYDTLVSSFKFFLLLLFFRFLLTLQVGND